MLPRAQYTYDYCNLACSSPPRAQQFGVFPIPLADNTTAHLYVGIRYGSAPDGLKCHEYQYWDAMQFDDAGHAKPLPFRHEITLDLAD